MAGASYAPIQRNNPAQGFATIPLFNAGGKWLNTNNFRFYRGVAQTFLRKAAFKEVVATDQTLTIPTPTCQISLE